MDLHYLEYFIEIAKENNITRAAENLFISQSALNQYLLKLEKELGTQLFVRSPRNWRLTEAGEIYLEGCRQALMVRQDTYKHIEDLVQSQSSTLTVGLTPIRGLEMFTGIFPSLHEKFPRVKITPIEMDAFSQLRAISHGDIDIGFLILPHEIDDSNTYIDLGAEEIILLVPRTHSVCKEFTDADSAADQMPVLNLRALSDTPFSLTRKGSTFRIICDSIFETFSFTPDVLMETSTTFHIAQITETGQCCGLIPYYYADTNNHAYRCFTLPDHPIWHLYIVHRKNTYLTSAAKHFIHLSQEYWNTIKINSVSQDSDLNPAAKHWSQMHGKDQ